MAPTDNAASERDDEWSVVIVWLSIGCILIGADVFQSDEPWGVAFSLGMLVLVMVIRGGWRYLEDIG